MSTATSKKAYRRHVYSGPRKSLKRVRGGLRQFYDEESRTKVWRSEKKKTPVNVVDNCLATQNTQPRSTVTAEPAIEPLPQADPETDSFQSTVEAVPIVKSEYNIICQLCLQSNVKMHEIRNQDHKSFIDNILELNGLVRDSSENYYACYICMSLLSKTYNFTQMVVNAHKHFNNLLQAYKQGTISELSNLDRQQIGVSYNNLSTASFEVTIDAADVTYDDGDINNFLDNIVHENEQTVHTNNISIKLDNIDDQTNNPKKTHDYIEEYLDDVWLSDQESSVTHKINRKRKKSSDENYASSSGEPINHDFHTHDGEGRLSKIPRNKVKYPKKVDQEQASKTRHNSTHDLEKINKSTQQKTMSYVKTNRKKTACCKILSARAHDTIL